MAEQSSNLVLVILAAGSFVQPLFFGSLFFFMFRLFPTRKETELVEAAQVLRHTENQRRFETIEGDIKQLLQHNDRNK